MAKYSDFINPAYETLGEPQEFRGDGVNFDVIPVVNSLLQPKDRVLLDIRTATSKNVLVAGNPLWVETLRGYGRLAMVDLKDGGITNLFLEPGSETDITSDNIVYWYENVGDESLILRDTCLGFDLDHEPGVDDVFEAVSRVAVEAILRAADL